jgi:hypothetical protein
MLVACNCFCVVLFILYFLKKALYIYIFPKNKSCVFLFGVLCVFFFVSILF